VKPVRLDINGALASITLNDPARRNTISIDMLDTLETAIRTCAEADDVHVVRLAGAGGYFSAGFDLEAAVAEPSILEDFIERLSVVLRHLRRLPQPVVAVVEGGAIAGGCALASASDFVCASVSAKFGYPVLRLGLSPAVSAPTLMQTVGDGHARMMMLEGRLLSGTEAHRIGLITHLLESEDAVAEAADALCGTLLEHGPGAMRATKQWLNELDGSLDDTRFDGPARDTGQLATGDETVRMLRAFWETRSK
jgi:enoyl-CoA hydratase/carnithine racemase